MSTAAPVGPHGPVVIVGGGLAAATAVVTLREQGYDGPLVVHAAEPHVPYERPGLSKGYLARRDPAQKLEVRPEQWYAEHGVDLRLGSVVERVDLRERRVHTAAGSEPYDRLLIATGAEPRRLPLAERSGAPMTYLRTREDSDRIRGELRRGRRIAVLGAGFLGLEVAATAQEAGAHVTVVERAAQPLAAVLGNRVGARFAALHERHGVELRLGAEVATIERVDGLALVRLADGWTIAADLLVVGIGALPSVRLAEDAGLAVDNGILVDDRLRTSDPHVWAAGDVANAEHPVLGGRVRVEHWAHAKAHGAVAARNMLGADEPCRELPYFFTDQFDLGMEYVGHVGPAGYDDVVVQGDPDAGKYRAFWVRDGRVLAGMHVNDWDAIDTLRGLVGADAGELG